MDLKNYCHCCEHIVKQLELYYLSANQDEFYKIWKPLTSVYQWDQGLATIVNFKLRVYFAVARSTEDGSQETIKKLSEFLHENGTRFSKLSQLAPYYVLPYIEDLADHPLITEIRTDQWIDELQKEWKQLLAPPKVDCDSEASENKCNHNYQQIKEKYLKLKQDHKLLIGLASQLITALENSLQGETKRAVEALKTYKEKATIMGDRCRSNQSDDPRFHWEASSMRKTPSTETIFSDTPTKTVEFNKEN